jgi:streptogramin lyase
LLAGCSNNLGKTPSVSQPAANVRTAAKSAGDPEQRLVFFSDSKGNLIDVWNRSDNNLFAVLSDGLKKPLGLATDAQDNLYVANGAAENVLMYAFPYAKTPTLTLVDRGYTPNGVAVAADGTVAVTNKCSTAKGCPAGSGSVVLYAPGKTTPCSTIRTPDYNSLAFGAFDSAGDFYFDGLVQKKGSVSIVQGGCAAASYNMLSSDYAFKAPGGMQFGPHGRLSIVDSKVDAIVTFSATGDALTKVSTTYLNANTTIDPTAFAFTKAGDTAFVANTGGGSGDKFEFPQGGDSKQTYAIGGTPSGVAVTPPFPL